MTAARRCTVALGLAALACLARPAPGTEERRYTLAELIRRTLMTSPELRVSQRGADAARARRGQADAARFPQVDVRAGLAPSPRGRGTVVSSPDSKNHPVINGVFGRGDLTLIQPIFTFGRIAGLREAATQAVEVEEEKTRETTAELVLRIKQLYYGKLLAVDLLALIDEISEDLDGAIDKARRRLEGGAPNADETDLFKLRSYRAVAGETRSTVAKEHDLATMALRTFAGLPAADPVALDVPGLAMPPTAPGNEADNVATALDLRPEMRQARAGARATQALTRAEHSQLFPQFGILIEGYYAKASNRDFQTNPFIWDPLNDRFGVVALALQYHLDFGITLGRIRHRRRARSRSGGRALRQAARRQPDGHPSPGAGAGRAGARDRPRRRRAVRRNR
jgi:outer membrane protein TolC